MDTSSKIRYAEAAKADKIRYSSRRMLTSHHNRWLRPKSLTSGKREYSVDGLRKPKKKRAEISKEYKKTGTSVSDAIKGVEEYMSKNKCYEKHIKACKFNPEPPNYDGNWW